MPGAPLIPSAAANKTQGAPSITGKAVGGEGVAEWGK